MVAAVKHLCLTFLRCLWGASNLPTSSAVINIGRQEDITLQDSHLMQEDLEPEGMRMRVDDFGGDNVMGDIPFYLPGRQDVEAARAGDDLDQSYRPLDEPTIELSPRPPSPDFATKGFSLDDSRRGGAEEDITMQPPEMDFPEGPVVDLDMPRTPQTNFSNHAEVEPLSPAPAVRGLKISRRKRKLVVDERTEIPGEDIRRGLQPDGPNDITRAPYTPNLTRLTFELGPPTKKAMLCRETMTQSVESQLSIPRQSSWAPRLREHFQASLVYHSSFTDAAAAEAAVKENEDLLAFLPEDHPEMPVQPEMEYPEQQIDYDQQEREYHMEPDTTLNDTTIGGAAEAPLYDVLPNLDEEDTGTRQVSAEEFGRIAWSKRTKLMLASFKTSFEEDPAPKQYSVLTAGKSRRSAAACLFELLVLKTKDFIEVEQLEPFADITITATDNLFNCDPAVAMEMDVLLPTQ